ncbi:unnamed protein product, partial [Didymodactylos carnosus]
TFENKQVSFVMIVPTLMITLCEHLDDNNYFERLKTVRSFCLLGIFTQQMIPIGRPLPNYQFYLLDEYLQFVSIGQIGEIYIGGKEDDFENTFQ